MAVARRVVGVFGGSFNPPHVSHVLAVAYAELVACLDEVTVVPVYQHPFSKELVPFDTRLKMCELAFEKLPFVQVSAIERELGGESRTLRTLEELAARRPDVDLRLILGSDVLKDLSKWHRFDRIEAIAPPLFLERIGHPSRDGSEGVLPEASSSEVRRLLGTKEPSAVERARVGELVPRRVLEYIRTHALYESDDRRSST